MGVAGVPGLPGPCVSRAAIADYEHPQLRRGAVWTKPERDKLAVKPITWKDGRSARELASRRVRLFFVVRDAHLYSFRASSSSFRSS